MLVRTDTPFSVSKWLLLTQHGFGGDTVHTVKGELLCLTRAVVARTAFSSPHVQTSQSNDAISELILEAKTDKSLLVQNKK